MPQRQNGGTTGGTEERLNEGTAERRNGRTDGAQKCREGGLQWIFLQLRKRLRSGDFGLSAHLRRPRQDRQNLVALKYRDPPEATPICVEPLGPSGAANVVVDASVCIDSRSMGAGRTSRCTADADVGRAFSVFVPKFTSLPVRLMRDRSKSKF